MGRCYADPALTDREAALLHVIREIHTGTLLNGSGVKFSGGFTSCPTDLKIGDVVLALTSGINPWTVAEVVKPYNGAVTVVRPLGGGRLCRFSNEAFTVLRGLKPDDPMLLTGLRRKIHRWSVYAFSGRYNRGWDTFARRWGGCDFVGDDTARIYVRETWGGHRREADGSETESRPLVVECSYSKRTRLRDVVAAVREQGRGPFSERITVKTATQGAPA